MHVPSDKPNHSDVIREREDETRAKQAEAELEFRNVTNGLRKKLNDRYGAEITEGMEHDLRAYVRTYFETHKDWPPTLGPSDPTAEKIANTDRGAAVETKRPKRKALAKADRLEPSDFTTGLAKSFDDFDGNWSTADSGLDESPPREELIKSEILANIRAESKSVVDETVGKELELLKKAHARDMGE